MELLQLQRPLLSFQQQLGSLSFPVILHCLLLWFLRAADSSRLLDLVCKMDVQDFQIEILANVWLAGPLFCILYIKRHLILILRYF